MKRGKKILPAHDLHEASCASQRRCVIVLQVILELIDAYNGL